MFETGLTRSCQRTVVNTEREERAEPKGGEDGTMLSWKHGKWWERGGQSLTGGLR